MKIWRKEHLIDLIVTQPTTLTELLLPTILV